MKILSDYISHWKSINGKDTLYSNGEDLETEDLQKFCEYLDMMPDLWSRKTDGLEFENSQLTKQVEHLKSALEKIANGTQPYNEREAFSFVETAKAIAEDALKLNDVF
jgi:hypothetical protein